MTVAWRQLKNQVEMKHSSKEIFKLQRRQKDIYGERERISPRTCVLSVFSEKSQQREEDRESEKRGMNYTFSELWTPGSGPTVPVPSPNQLRWLLWEGRDLMVLGCL